MRYVYRGAAVALSILAGSTILGHGAAQNLSITNFQVVSQQVVTPTQSRVIYRADLVNPGSSFASVSATATTTNPFMVRVVPGSDTLTFAPVPASSQTTSLNTFTVLINPNVPFNSASLEFTFQAVAGPLMANAGPNQNAQVGQTVTLNGSGSTSAGGPLAYSWMFVSMPPGSAAVLSSPGSVMPSFTVDVAGTYVIQLTVSSGGATSSATVQVSTSHVPPTANAGPNQTVLVGATVTLDGSGSFDLNNAPLTYAWFVASVPPGSSATLSGANTVNPTFVADKSGNYKIQLLVNDGVSNSTLASVTISTVNSPPVANAGPSQANVVVGSLVQLNGAASSDTDGNPLTYSWSLILFPAGSSAVLSSSTAVNPTFTADKDGVYVAQLIVSDLSLPSAPATVLISTPGAKLPPTANAGPNQTVPHGTKVTLAGSGTDPQSLPLTFLWTLLTKPAGSTAVLSSTTIANPMFTADLIGPYVAQLVVNNGYGSSAPSMVTISTTNTAPVANAGSARSVQIGATVLLDGSGSSDADHDPLTYSWTLLTKPSGSTATLTAATTVAPMFVADKGGNYVIQLIVNDGTVNSAPSTVMITAASMPGITLSPSTQTLISGPGMLTITLTAAAGAGGQVINLASSNPAAAIVPTMITIPMGSTGANITVTPGGTMGTTTISATASGFTAGTATVISNISQIILPSGVVVGPNASVPFQVTLVTPSPDGTFVSLNSSDTTVVSVSPTFFYIQPGATTPFRAPQVTGVGFGTATITASASGLASASQTVSVGSSIGFNPTSLAITGTAKGLLTLTLSSPAPAGGLTINVSIDNPAVATVPSSVFIPANGLSVSIPVTGVSSGSTVVHASSLPILADTTASITVVGAAQVVLPAYLIIGQWGFSGPMPVTLSNPAPAGGVTISLSSDAPNVCSVSPSSIFVAAGATTPATQPILTGNDIGYANITASAPGYLAGSVQVHDTDQITIGLQDGVTVRVGQSVPYVVALPGAAPAGGVTITLTSLDPTKLTIPASVFIPAGQLIATVPIQVTGISPGTVTIRASSPAYSTEVQSVQVLANL